MTFYFGCIIHISIIAAMYTKKTTNTHVKLNVLLLTPGTSTTIACLFLNFLTDTKSLFSFLNVFLNFSQ